MGPGADWGAAALPLPLPEEEESRCRSLAERADALVSRVVHRLLRRAPAVLLPPVELPGKGGLRSVTLVQLAAGKEKSSVPACVSLREPE